MRYPRASDRDLVSAEEAALRSAWFDEECGKLDPTEERALAEEGLAADLAGWPEYRPVGTRAAVQTE